MSTRVPSCEMVRDTTVASAGLIPLHPSAPMFTNSGMMPFVPYFLGDQPAPGTLHLNRQGVQRCGNTREAVVAGPPQLRRKLGQLLHGRSQEPDGIQTVGVLTDWLFEHTSSLEHMSDNFK